MQEKENGNKINSAKWSVFGGGIWRNGHWVEWRRVEGVRNEDSTWGASGGCLVTLPVKIVKDHFSIS